MIIIKILRWLRGYLLFTAAGEFPERFLNLALREDIAIYNPVGEKGKLTAQVQVSDYRNLRKIAKKAKVRLRIKKKYGLPFLIYRNKNRGGLIAGAVLFLIIVNVLSLFVWSVEITGQKEVSYTRIRNALADSGIYAGAYKGNINVPAAERKTAMDLGQIGWMSVNIIGSKAVVEISESIDMPEIVPADKPCNIKASQAGQIVKMEVAKGSSAVKIGDGVAKGQLLVSGVVVDENNNTSTLVHSEAKVYASIHHKESVAVNKKREAVLPAEKIIRRRQAQIFGFKIPLDFTEIPKGNFISQEKTESLVINGNKLPVCLLTEKNYEYESVNIELTEKQAQKSGEILLALNDVFAMWDKDIVKREVKLSNEKESYVFNADYYCIEDIAQQTAIDILD